MTRIRIEFAGAATGHDLRAPAATELVSLLRWLRLEPTSARARFADENGPKGGRAIRCSLEVRLPRRPPVHVAQTATTTRLALDGALAKLARQLTRLRDTGRALKRRPKKYFVAKRALTR